MDCVADVFPNAIYVVTSDFDTRHQIQPKETSWFWEDGGVPTLFMHGADKGFDFHPPFLKAKLTKQEGCHFVSLRKGDEGTSRKTYKMHAWQRPPI